MINEICFETYDEFKKSIILEGKLFSELCGFVFRGHAIDKWSLLPGALRPENKNKLFEMSRIITWDTSPNYGEKTLWQITNEFNILSQFYSIANNQGLKLPKIKLIQDHLLDDYNHTFNKSLHNEFKWISPDLVELASLAQHYGAITRMLDWTQDILVALYFSALDACRMVYNDYANPDEMDITSDNIIIWAINFRYLELLKGTKLPCPLKFVVPSYSENPNINAQKGVLSYWELYYKENSFDLLSNHVDRTPIDQLILQYGEEKGNIQAPFLYKIKLSISYCLQIVNELNIMGYCSSRLFPSYYGVNKQMNDEMMLRRLRDLIDKRNV